MEYDPNNHVVILCVRGMALEGEGQWTEANHVFNQAWNEATDDFEKHIASHYVARHQKTVSEKLKWDKRALKAAKKIKGNQIQSSFPSLYLNIAKCYEDLSDSKRALKNYHLALSFSNRVADSGYGNLIRGGILSGIDRMNKKSNAGEI